MARQKLYAYPRFIGHRRNLSSFTVGSFVVLSAIGSLGYALNLFFIVLLFTPLVHNAVDAHFTPKPAVYYVPIVTSFLFLYQLPTLLVKDVDVTFVRLGYIALPLFLAFAPQVSSLQV